MGEIGRVLDGIREARIVPVVDVPDAATAAKLATVLAENGLPVVELTLRTPAALEGIAAAVEVRPEMIVGAGTIIDAEGLERAIGAGAKFGVSPGFDRQLSDAARTAGFPYVPGTVTASEIQAGLAAGHRLLKFFPAEASGGLPALRALAAPFAPFGAEFMPTGGISADNAEAWLSTPPVAAVGGSWIAPAKDLAAGAWDEIAARARAAASLGGVAR